MEIDVSRAAAKFVQRRGGRLFVWFRDLGARSAFATQHVSIAAPPDVDFVSYDAGDFEVMLPVDYEPP
jgi:hypothetical protein